MQLHSLASGQHALTTTGGVASILLGAGVVSNRNAIVAGDGSVSHGAGSITAAGGFWDGSARVATVGQLAATGHSFIHTHVNTMAWQMPFTLLGLAFCGLVITELYLLISRRSARSASHAL